MGTAAAGLGAGPAIAAGGSTVYSYDSLGRIAAAFYDSGVCVRYGYDASGNRLTETVNVIATGSVGRWGCFNWGAAKWGTQ